MTSTSIQTTGEQVAGKYLSFFLSREEYGIAILKVREIIEMTDVTPLPKTPDFVCGVINLRGKIIPVIDLRQKFGMAAEPHTEDSCIVVVDMEVEGVDHTTGCIVDRVSEVMNVEEKDVEPAPKCARVDNTDFIFGLAKLDERVLILLDIDRILDTDELLQLGELRGDQPSAEGANG